MYGDVEIRNITTLKQLVPFKSADNGTDLSTKGTG